jgi:hypothetical protein
MIIFKGMSIFIIHVKTKTLLMLRSIPMLFYLFQSYYGEDLLL